MGTRATVTPGHADVLEAQMLRTEAEQMRDENPEQADNLIRLADKIDR